MKMSKRRQFWVGFFIVFSLVAAGIAYAVWSTGWEYALILIGGVGICLAIGMLFIVGLAMMIDAKVSK